MTEDEIIEIIEMARQAGVDMSLGEHWSFFIEELKAFAKLVAEKAIKEALAQPDQEPEWYHGIDVYGCNRFYHKTEDRTSEFNTPLYTTPLQRKPLSDEEIAVERALDNLLYWTERAVNKGNANSDIEEAMQQYNDALAAAHGIKGD